MGEEDPVSEYDGGGGDGEEERVMEWEAGLPSTDDLMPLSQTLIPVELASAFSISPEPRRSMLEVGRASQNTLSSLRRQNSSNFGSNNHKSLPSFAEERDQDDDLIGETEEVGSSGKDGSESRKLRRLESNEEADSALRGTDNSNDDQSARTLKRPRLVWTSQLHKRFVDVVAHLGIKNAVPKTIMQLMNVEGLTRENVASHLQKYRLYLKRMQGLSNEGPSSSDQLFASTPVPQNLHESGGHMPLPMPYGAPLMPMPGLGVAHGHGHVPMQMNNPTAGYNGYESHPYNMYREQQRDWPGNNFGSRSYNMSLPHVSTNDK